MKYRALEIEKINRTKVLTAAPTFPNWLCSLIQRRERHSNTQCGSQVFWRDESNCFGNFKSGRSLNSRSSTQVCYCLIHPGNANAIQWGVLSQIILQLYLKGRGRHFLKFYFRGRNFTRELFGQQTTKAGIFLCLAVSYGLILTAANLKKGKKNTHQLMCRKNEKMLDIFFYTELAYRLRNMFRLLGL